jgi:hypothetical protein
LGSVLRERVDDSGFNSSLFLKLYSELGLKLVKLSHKLNARFIIAQAMVQACELVVTIGAHRL